MFNFQNIIRPNILKLNAYSCARDEYRGGKATMLDANENSLGSPADFKAAVLNRYPSASQQELKQAVAGLKGVQAQQIFLGSGSDEVMDLLMRACCIPGKDNIVITPPTYGMYRVLADTNDIAVKEVRLSDEFQISVSEILETIDENTKLIFICSPNNPTGNVMEKKAMITLCQNFKGLVVVDEAYIDFCEASKSMQDQLELFPNLVILQTFSKAWGLAGIRLGICFGSPELIQTLNKIKLPYNISTPTSLLAREALEQIEEVNKKTTVIISERERLRKALEETKGVEKVFPSDANFLLIQVPSAKKIYEQLIAKKIVVRFRGNLPGCEETLRVTIGTPAENDLFLSTLTSLL